MRYLTAPWAAMLGDGSWLDHARHANDMARRLADRLRDRGVTIAHPVDANSVFARLHDEQREGLRRAGWELYEFIGGASRFVCSWQTSEADIDAVVADLP